MGITQLKDQKFIIEIASELEKIGQQIEELASSTHASLQPVFDEAGRSMSEFASETSEALKAGGESMDELLERREIVMDEASRWFSDVIPGGEAAQAVMPP